VKKAVKISLILIFSTVIMLGLLYMGLAYYYRNVFPYGTFINNTYCTGLTPEEAADEMNESVSLTDITVKMPAGYGEDSYVIGADDIGLSYDYLTPLKQFKQKQDPLLWIANLGNEFHDEIVAPDVNIDEDALKQIVSDWHVDRLGAPHTVSIEEDTEGYILRNNKAVIDRDLCLAQITDHIKNGETDIRLDDTCVTIPAYTADEQRILDQYEAMEGFANKVITFHLDNEDVVLNREELYSLLPGQNGLPEYDPKAGRMVMTEESVLSGLYDVLSPYNTYNNHYFTTHNGRKVHLTQGTLGNSIDVEKAAKELYEALEKGNDDITIDPEYKHKMDDNEKTYGNETGDTYIEISLDEQHMYYYEKGALKLDTNVVTGKMSTGSGTKEGVYYIYYMQRNRTLIGETYRSFVNYWMAFNRHVGIHDATWRTQWGEDAYLRAGSHGCVNTPFDAAKELYDYAYVGLPVIVYSYEKSEVTE